MPSRREFLRTGGLALVGLGLTPDSDGSVAELFQARPGSPAPLEVEVIEMRSDVTGSRAWFDPIGLYVEPGTTVRWIVRDSVHTTTAYHPDNEQHSLRIPEGATPWDSGYLVNPGDRFDVKLTVPGVYDYYCLPHEAAGMVGRIIVGQAGGPGNLDFDYWVGRPGTEAWRPVPDAARRTFPDAQRIQNDRRVRARKVVP